MPANNKLNDKQKAFVDKYLETGNQTEAYKSVYKNVKNDNTAKACACRTLTKAYVREYYESRLKEIESERIAKPKEIMEYLTKVMRGEEKDQFGLEATLQDRTKAAELLGKRYRIFDKNNVDENTLKEMDKLELENKRLQNEKIKAEIERMQSRKGSAHDGEIKEMLEGIINEL